MDSIGVGILGYGYAGRIFHRQLVEAVDGLRVAAVAARGAEARERAAADCPDSRVVDSLDALLALDSVDLVVLATPHHVHCEQALAVLAAGRPVVTDKIMCRSVAEADAMIAAAARAGRLLSVFHNRRWDSDFLTVRAALEAGLLGDIYNVDIAVVRPSAPLRPLGGPPRWRARAEAFGGQLVDWGAHLMDQAVLLGGSEPDSVFCDLQYRQEGCETDTEGFVALRYAGGLRLTVTVSVQSWLEKPHWFVTGSRGGLAIWGVDPQERPLRDELRVVSGTPEATLGAAALQTAGDASSLVPVPGRWTAYYENIRDVLRGEAEPAVTAEQCRDALRVYERCFAAAGQANACTRSRPAGWLG